MRCQSHLLLDVTSSSARNDCKSMAHWQVLSRVLEAESPHVLDAEVETGKRGVIQGVLEGQDARTALMRSSYDFLVSIRANIIPSKSD